MTANVAESGDPIIRAQVSSNVQKPLQTDHGGAASHNWSLEDSTWSEANSHERHATSRRWWQRSSLLNTIQMLQDLLWTDHTLKMPILNGSSSVAWRTLGWAMQQRSPWCNHGALMLSIGSSIRPIIIGIPKTSRHWPVDSTASILNNGMVSVVAWRRQSNSSLFVNKHWHLDMPPSPAITLLKAENKVRQQVSDGPVKPHLPEAQWQNVTRQNWLLNSSENFFRQLNSMTISSPHKST